MKLTLKHIAISIFFCFLFVPIGYAANLDIPAFSGTIQSPDGFTFDDYHLKFFWFCSEDTLTPISISSSRPCGGFGKKNGTQIIDISKDGSFTVSPVSAKRFSLIRNPKFYLRLGLFQNETKDNNTNDNEYSKRYVTGQNYDVSKQLQNDLSQLRVIRILGGKFKTHITARESNGEIIHFNLLMEKYPKSYNFDSTVTLVLKVSDRESQVTAHEVIDSQVEIPNIEILQVGLSNTISTDVLIRASIGLVNKEGAYKFYHEEIWLRDLPIKVNENLEASFDQNFLKNVEIIVNVQ